jgi:hypothetical protein
MRKFILILPIILLPVFVGAADLSLSCQGKTRFIHRGAPSTYPVDEKRSYAMRDGVLAGMPCNSIDNGVACFGLTAQQAMRRVMIDVAAKTVSDTLELPTSLLIFEGRCD